MRGSTRASCSSAKGLTDELTAWGVHPNSAAGREIKLKVQISTPGLVVATAPEAAYEGPIVVWAKNKAGLLRTCGDQRPGAVVVRNRNRPRRGR